jgi:hypothetical protein
VTKTWGPGETGSSTSMPSPSSLLQYISDIGMEAVVVVVDSGLLEGFLFLDPDFLRVGVGGADE